MPKRLPYTAEQVRLKRLRQSLGLSQDELANNLGVASSTVARWEHGRDAPIPAMLWLALKALGAHADP